jgi:histidine triad (HIT) family protein
MPDECIFCQIVAGRKPAAIVYQTETVLAFRDIAPQAPTHILIVPRRHIANVADLSAEDAPLMGDLILAARAIGDQEGVSDGFRLVINSGRPAGQSVFHLHVHLLAGRRMAWPPG